MIGTMEEPDPFGLKKVRRSARVVLVMMIVLLVVTAMGFGIVLYRLGQH
jgi:flagellar basal body-associated protein FliL